MPCVKIQRESLSFVAALGWTTGLRIIGLPLQFLVFLAVARYYPLEDVGLYALANAIWQAFKGLGPLGLDIAAMRFGPALQATGRSDAVQSLEAASQRIVLFVGTVSAVLVIAALRLLPQRTSVSGLSAAVIGVGVPLFAIIGLQVGQLRARNLVRAAQFPESVLLNALAGTLIAFGAVICHASIDWVLASTVIAASAVAVVNQLRFRRLHGPRTQQLESALRLQVTRATLHMFSGQALVTIGSRVSPIFIAAVAGRTATGLFEAASRLGQLASISTWAAGVAAAPQLASAHAASNLKRFQHVIVLASWSAFLPAAIICAITIVAGKQLLHLFGMQYVVAYPAAVLVSIATTINAAGGLSTTAFYMAGKEQLVVWLTAISVLGVVVTLWLTLPTHGIIGAGVALIVGSVIRDGGASAMLGKTMGAAPGVLSLVGAGELFQILRRRMRHALRRDE
jgi:O-antigen/teichoic acid export membrane protein